MVQNVAFSVTLARLLTNFGNLIVLCSAVHDQINLLCCSSITIRHMFEKKYHIWFKGDLLVVYIIINILKIFPKHLNSSSCDNEAWSEQVYIRLSMSLWQLQTRWVYHVCRMGFMKTTTTKKPNNNQQKRNHSGQSNNL